MLKSYDFGLNAKNHKELIRGYTGVRIDQKTTHMSCVYTCTSVTTPTHIVYTQDSYDHVRVGIVTPISFLECTCLSCKSGNYPTHIWYTKVCIVKPIITHTFTHTYTYIYIYTHIHAYIHTYITTVQ